MNKVSNKDSWNTGRMRCSWCGRFVSYEDIDIRLEYSYMAIPDSDYSSETWENVCKNCNKKQMKEKHEIQ